MRGTIVTKEKCICCRGVQGVLANTQSVFFYHKHNTVFLDKPFADNNTASKWPFCQNANVLEAQLRTKLADNTKLFCFLEHLTDLLHFSHSWTKYTAQMATLYCLTWQFTRVEMNFCRDYTRSMFIFLVPCQKESRLCHGQETTQNFQSKHWFFMGALK